MKNIFKILILIFFVSIQTGCKKFLDEKQFSSLDLATFPKSEEDLRVLANGLYIMFEANEGYGRSNLILTDIFSDELTTIATSGPRYEMQNHLITPVNSEIDQFWVRNYIIISRANVIIKQAPLSGLSDAVINPYLAEARFIRAHCYFELVKMFGNVPLVLESFTELEDLKAQKPSRTEQSLVYKQIIEDFKYAELNLKKEAQISSGYKGTASSGAATSLLAKVYLTRAYMPFKEADDFQNAAAACEKVINSKEYNLFPNYSDVFNVTKENGIEHIFSIQFDQAPNRAGGMTGFLVDGLVYPNSFGSFPAERKFYDSFPSTDVIRKKFNFYDQGVGITGTPYNYLTTPTTNPFCAKYRDDALALTTFNDRCNFLIIRYADVLLMHSEALNRINPADPNKYIGINKVRFRVNLGLLSGLDQNAFENAVLDERHWEFCFEGKRRDDLIRMGKLVTVLTAAGFTNIKDFHRYYPVPQPQINLNTNLLPQNNGYQ
ncbi:RagB/SusD family nutrient uptake outer membrane protein [Pedobacter petrophilus]|uniref:RagB/SusD family nutrient uptake outer membrane protein n=2 Tax=Pedobacter TaxID=84567 RepID=A0A7K0G033_9SPHI|nr:RagB/SusD family nutrient uptake outer membrane protein [Pedobacter petrophilus]MRX76962.1 RagB/SusD family nutrient uptake outer membrane protein [Pedobacter petrophilus]